MKAADYHGIFDNAVPYEGTVSYYAKNYGHRVVLDHLEPGTEYVYRVGDRELGVWSEPGTFVTDAGKDSAFSFLAIADVQAGSEENFQKASELLDKGFETVPDAQFVANMGDFINDCNNEQWDMYFRNFKRHHLRATLAPVAGNHDGMPGWFRQQFPVSAAEPSLGLTGDCRKQSIQPVEKGISFRQNAREQSHKLERAQAARALPFPFGRKRKQKGPFRTALRQRQNEATIKPVRRTFPNSTPHGVSNTWEGSFLPYGQKFPHEPRRKILRALPRPPDSAQWRRL